ncbi:MAG TPA: hypothetical protein VGL89_12090 [Candidatus Koribacter sp.]|jgi:ribulose kinase
MKGVAQTHRRRSFSSHKTTWRAIFSAKRGNYCGDSGRTCKSTSACGEERRSKSALWLQIKADVFGKPVTAACRGAAIRATVGSGAFAAFEKTVTAFVPKGTVYEPRHNMHQRYDEIFCRHKDMARRLFGYESPPRLLSV